MNRDAKAKLEMLLAQERFIGYSYALTDVVNAMTDYLKATDTIVLTAQDVVDVTNRLMGAARAGGDGIPSR